MSVKTWSAALLCGAVLSLPVAAQEDTPKDEPAPAAEPETKPAEAPKKKGYQEPALHRWGGWTIGLGVWQPTLVGADEDVALAFPSTAPPYTVRVGATESIRETWRVAYHIPNDLGSIVFKYDSMKYDDQVDMFTPGDFGFYEIRAVPGFRGGFDDGFADGVSTHAVRKSRMASLQFNRTFVDGPRARMSWGAGMQNIDSSRAINISYLAIVPNLPPVIPPVVAETSDSTRLNPLPDQVDIRSDFSGNGIVGSLEAEFPLHPRVSIVSGLSIGLMRGRLSTYYTSFNAFYFDATSNQILTSEELFDILANGTSNQIASVAQGYFAEGLQTTSVSRLAQTYDLSLGVQGNIWRGLKIFALYRTIYVANAAAYTVPRSDGTIETTEQPSAYDGYILGLSWRF